MTSVIFSVPGKTFIAGEYAVLKGGRALIAATEPRFELHVARGNGELEQIHPQSPAGKFARTHADFFKKFSLSFQDTLGVGGFGASTAQFLSVYALLAWQGQGVLDSEKYLDRHQMLKDYLACAWDGEGYPPSGADLLGQERGFLTSIDKQTGRFSGYSWNFENLGFELIHTGVKLATHEHLKKAPDFNPEKMNRSLLLWQEALNPTGEASGREICLLEAVDLYAEALAEQGLTAEHSLKLCRELRSAPGLRAIKACGAMGADVLFAVVDKNQREEFRRRVRERALRLVASEKNLSEGLQVKVLKGDLF